MRRLTTFTVLSLNGYYKDENNGIGWHKHDAEALEISRENLRNDGTTLLFGRKTYEEFASFWPSEQAFSAFPEIAGRMSSAEKIVFSRNSPEITWVNARLAQNSLVEEIKQLKSSSGGGITLLGSGEIVRQLANLNLIDDYMLLIAPVVLGQGTPLFSELSQNLELTLHASRSLKNGSMLMHYQAS